MHPLCKNENIPMWGKHRYLITIPGSLLKAFEKMNNKLKVRVQILHVLSACYNRMKWALQFSQFAVRYVINVCEMSVAAVE